MDKWPTCYPVKNVSSNVVGYNFNRNQSAHEYHIYHFWLCNVI